MSGLQSKLKRNKLRPTEIKSILKMQMNQVMELGAENAMKCLFIEGYHGQGKTSVVVQTAKELTESLRAEGKIGKDENVDCLLLNLTAKEATDFTGLPTNYSKEVKNEVKIYSTFGHPRDLPDSGYGILFLDESNRVQDRDMKSTLLSLLNDRMVNGNKLGDNWIIAMAGNPFDDDRYEVGEFDSALADRVNLVFYESSYDIVMNYLSSKEKYKGHFMLDFLAENPKFIEFDGGEMTPRRIEKSMIDTLQFKENYEENKDLVFLLLRVGLGHGPSQAVEKFLNAVEVPKVDNILKNDEKCFKILEKQRTNNPMVNGLNKGLMTRLVGFTEDKKKLTNTQSMGLINYFYSINSENKYAFAQSLFDQSNDLNQLITDHVLKWKPSAKMDKELATEMQMKLKDLKDVFLKIYENESMNG